MNPNAGSPPPTAAAAPGDRGKSQGTDPAHGTSAHSFKSYALTAVLALVFGMIGAYGFLQFLDNPQRPSDTTGADQPAGSGEAGPTTRDLSDQVAKLSDRVDGVTRRIDALPKPAPPPDLSDLQVQVAEISKVTEELGPIREAIKRIDDRLGNMGQTIRSLGDEVHAVPPRVRPTSAGTERAQRREDIAPVPEKPVDDEALARGAELFQQKKYKDALDLFNRMGLTNPDDARVWYFAALAHGFANNQWKDDGTGSLVEKGIACERAGKPPRPVIDETFKNLTSATGKDWLAAYRKRANTR